MHVHLLVNSTLLVALILGAWTVLLRIFYSENKTHYNFKSYFLKVIFTK